MSWFGDVGNWFRGAFNDDDDKKKKVTQQNKATKVNWKPDTSRGATNLDISRSNINQSNEPKKVVSLWETDDYKKVNKLFQQNLPSARQKEEDQLGWFSKHVTDRGWENRAANNARLKAIGQVNAENNYKPTAGTTSALIDTQNAVKAQQAKDRAARAKTQNAADIVRLVPFAGGIEAVVNQGRVGVAAVEDLFTGKAATRENQRKVENAIRQEQLQITPGQWAMMSDEDRMKYASLLYGGHALGAVDFIPFGSAAKIPLKLGIKYGTKQLGKTLATNTAVGGTIGGGFGYGTASLLGVNDEAKRAATIDGIKTGILGGIFGTPVDSVIDSAAKTARVASRPSGIMKTLDSDPMLTIDTEVSSRLLDAQINEVRLDSNNPYPASYNDGVVTVTGQNAFDEHIYHEAGHALWEKQLTPEEKALFKGDGDASKQAVGRPGYTDEMVRSEDFSDYLNKALTGKFDEVPDQFKAIIAKYAGITAKSEEAATAAARSLVAKQQARLEEVMAANPNMTSEQIAEATQKIKQEMLELAERAKESRQQTLEVVNRNQARNVETTGELARQQEEVEAAKVAAATPQEGDRLQTPFGNEEVAANDAYIRASDLSTGDARRSPEVTPQEFMQHRARGQQKLEALNKGSSNPVALEDPASWNNIVDESYQVTRAEWGGATIDAHTGKQVPIDADAYALTIKDPGMESVSVSPQASPADFAAAMNAAKQRFAQILARQDSHLGVFHDADTGMIDIDPVLITKSLEDVHDIGAYTRSTGGAYHFKSGDGYWAPHIADNAIPQPKPAPVENLKVSGTSGIPQPRNIPIRAVPSDSEITARFEDAVKRLQAGYEIEMNAAMKKPELTRNLLVRQIQEKYDQKFAMISKMAEDGTIGKRIEVTKLPDSPSRVNTPDKAAPPPPDNPYTGLTNEQILYGDQAAPDVRDNLSIGELLSPDRLIRQYVTRPVQEGVNATINAAQRSQIAPIRGVGRLFTGFSKEAGRSADDITAAMRLRGGVETGKFNRETIAQLSESMTPDQKTRVWATLDPEQSQRLGIDVKQLTPEEIELQGRLKGIIDNTTQENLRRGLITDEQAAQPYIKRAYTFYDDVTETQDKFERGFRQELMNQYKGREKLDDAQIQEAITDPTYLVGKKTAESEAVWAMQDYGNYLSESGRAVDTPLKGYTQLPNSAVFGESAGKWVPRAYAEDFTGFQYTNAMVSAMNDVLQIYDRWNLRQAKKQILTIFNPAVRLGNQVTNRGIFAQLAGVNPIEFNAAFAETKYMMDRADPLIREAIDQGLTGVDITQAEFYARQFADVTKDSNAAKRFIKFAQDSYSGADDQARITAYVIKRRRGYSPEEAARQVQRGFQDYKSVGFFYDMAAKTPLIGNAFVRFVADSIRIAKNAAVEHPLRTIATIAMWNTFVNAMSVASGESELKEDNTIANAPANIAALATGETKSDAQKTREDRYASPKLPFSDVSMAVQTPWGEVNVARFMPWYQLNSINSGAQKFLPLSESPVTISEDGKPEFNGSGFNDPLLGQFVQLAFDKDFRNRSIQDPDNNVDADKYALDELPMDERLKNVGRFLFTQNVPLGREADALVSAATGAEDVYGKVRSVPQAIARAGGFKVEQFGEEQVAKQKGTEAYFEDLEKITDQLKEMTPSEQEAWKRLTGYYKLREQVENNFEPGTLRDKKAPVYEFSEDKWKDYAANPRLYELMVEKKQQDLARSGTPVQPEFDERLSNSFRKQLLQNKMVAPGDDAELDQRMYSSPEWDYYQKLKDEFKEKAKEYYGESEFKGDELVKYQDEKFPDKPPVYKAYTEAYGKYVDGLAEKPEFTDEVKAAREQFQKDTFNWTNNARRARGLPPITVDMWQNPTFGYDSDASGSGWGWGSGRGGGGTRDVNTLTKLTNFSSDLPRLGRTEAEPMPNQQAIFRALLAGAGGGRPKPKLGASSRGQR